MSDAGAKSSLFDGFARVAQALASGRRAEIIDVLANGERTVESLAAVTNTEYWLPRPISRIRSCSSFGSMRPISLPDRSLTSTWLPRRAICRWSPALSLAATSLRCMLVS